MEPSGFACNVWKALRGLLPKIRNHHGIHPFKVKQQRNLSSSKWCSINYWTFLPPHPTRAGTYSIRKENYKIREDEIRQDKIGLH